MQVSISFDAVDAGQSVLHTIVAAIPTDTAQFTEGWRIAADWCYQRGLELSAVNAVVPCGADTPIPDKPAAVEIPRQLAWLALNAKLLTLKSAEDLARDQQMFDLGWDAARGNQVPVSQELYQNSATGGIYEVLCSATLEPDGVPMVVYRSGQTGERYVRPATDFGTSLFVRIGSNKNRVLSNSTR